MSLEEQEILGGGEVITNALGQGLDLVGDVFGGIFNPSPLIPKDDVADKDLGDGLSNAEKARIDSYRRKRGPDRGKGGRRRIAQREQAMRDAAGEGLGNFYGTETYPQVPQPDPVDENALALEGLLEELAAMKEAQFEAQRGAAAARRNRALEHLNKTQAKSDAYYDKRDEDITADYAEYAQESGQRFDDWYADVDARQQAVDERAADMGIDLAVSDSETTAMMQSLQADSIDYLNTIEGIAKDISEFARNSVDMSIADAIFKVGLQYENAIGSINAAEAAGEISDLEAQIALMREQALISENMGMLSYGLQQFNVDPELADVLSFLQIRGISDQADKQFDMIREMLGKDVPATIDISQAFGEEAGTSFADMETMQLLTMFQNYMNNTVPEQQRPEGFPLMSPADQGYIPFIDLEWAMKNPEAWDMLIQRDALPPIEAYDQDALMGLIMQYIGAPTPQGN